MTVVDAFPGNNEISLAEFRINYLSPIVDITVISESTLTHSGRNKPLYFTEWLRKNSRLKDKVRILELDLTIYNDPWSREIASRELLLNFVLSKYPTAHFVLSDLDEIPAREQLQAAISVRRNFHFLTPTVYLNANWHLRDSHANWSRGVIGHSSLLQKENGSRFEKLPVLRNPHGIHFSWLVESSDSIQKKVESGAHTELSEVSFLNSNLIRFACKYGIDHLGRFNEKGFGLLEIRGFDELSHLQKLLFDWNRGLFKFQLQEECLIKRVFASLVCTLLWRNPKSQKMCLRVVNGENILWKGAPRFAWQLSFGLIIGLTHFAKRVYRGIIESWLS